jgi:anthranilate synthase component 2
MTRILVIDNYDSFVYNLVAYLGQLGADCDVRRNDAVRLPDVAGYDGVLLSPGPGVPETAGVCIELIRSYAGRLPILGVCLGHQAIGQHFGGRVVRGGLMHGKTSPISHDGTGVFASLPSPFTATRYHSLIVEDIPGDLLVNATADDGSVMGFRHKTLPIHGVQFHPESIATEHGHALLDNFLRVARVPNRALV